MPVQNPIDRYLIDAPMLPQMKRNADGGVTILHPEGRPGRGAALQLAAGSVWPIYLVMRLFWPMAEAPSLLPIGKGTWQPPGVVRVF